MAIVQEIRSKIFKEIINRLNDLEGSVKSSESSVNETQLKINHQQLLLLNEIQDRTKNSGTIALSETELITKIFSGLKMYLDPRDLAITPHLALDGVWEHRITSAWIKVLKPNFTILDIGSNNGYYGALAAQLTDKKNSKIVMFEANPKLIPYIKKTLSVNWLNEQTVVENLAIGDKDGELTLNILENYIGSSSVHDNAHVESYMKGKMNLKTADSVKVKSTSVDLYCKRNKIKAVDLIIMDIEGYEDVAYAGMRDTVKQSPDLTLFVEFTPGGYKDPKGFYGQMLKDLGNVFVLSDDGEIVKPKSTNYETVIGKTDDWVMPIFSKNSKLAK